MKGLTPRIVGCLKGYNKEAFMKDLMAGIIVGIVALPLAIAFGIASGVTPEKGIITAIVAGFIISLLGGTKVQIGGPTGAFIVIIYGIVNNPEYGLQGLLIATLLAGVILIALGAFRLGAVIKFIPYPIIIGFTAGIAATIFTTQISDILGLTQEATSATGELIRVPLKTPGDFIGKWICYAKNISTFNLWNFIVSIGSLLVIIFLPNTMSVERRRLVAAYGAQVVLTPGDLGMSGAIARAGQLRDSIPGSIILGQFTNPGNPEAHYMTTGPEIWNECDVDVFVAGIGTGGTITGTAKYLKERKPSVEIIGIEPAGSPFLTEGRIGKHDLQGIGAGFKPDILDLSVVDRLVTVADVDAYAGARYLASQEGILCGITSGAAMHVGLQLAANPAYMGKNIVMLLTDTGERYLSTALFSHEAE